MEATIVKPVITIEEVLEAYEKTGLNPIKFSFIDKKRNCGCLITALACHKNNLTLDQFENELDKPMNEIAALIGMPEGFNVTALYDGFDDNGFNEGTEEFKLGRSIAEELEKRGMLEVK